MLWLPASLRVQLGWSRHVEVLTRVWVYEVVVVDKPGPHALPLLLQKQTKWVAVRERNQKARCCWHLEEHVKFNYHGLGKGRSVVERETRQIHRDATSVHRRYRRGNDQCRNERVQGVQARTLVRPRLRCSATSIGDHWAMHDETCDFSDGGTHDG
jgi:hypothetical protein